MVLSTMLNPRKSLKSFHSTNWFSIQEKPTHKSLQGEKQPKATARSWERWWLQDPHPLLASFLVHSVCNTCATLFCFPTSTSSPYDIQTLRPHLLNRVGVFQGIGRIWPRIQTQGASLRHWAMLSGGWVRFREQPCLCSPPTQGRTLLPWFSLDNDYDVQKPGILSCIVWMI